ncbi:hypothetical protein NY406_05050 [Chlorobaculum sp. MV4-Y]|jgi:hypothetical protein|uniref:hypothetical protein n=1 Tax=Chlorobaculum sp. MV4-Y TaxID=2976335 RepID=UPI0021AE8090|nr:hypothetical protein [Chlorobaculum sp. MV4-Y]UWX58632.1 hypothetical protein NY406_05050 [Chlorobaculum sp. MV4-Y]
METTDIFSKGEVDEKQGLENLPEPLRSLHYLFTLTVQRIFNGASSEEVALKKRRFHAKAHYVINRAETSNAGDSVTKTTGTASWPNPLFATSAPPAGRFR